MSLFHKHNWTRWKDDGTIVWYLLGHVGERAYRTREKLKQVRECKDCGKKQKRLF